MTGGELIGQERRLYLEGIFECKVFDWYNMWENVVTAIQCERGTYHFIPELGFAEVMRNSLPCKPGEVGEIVGTHLENYEMLLIRYNMNDLASPIGSACGCGRSLDSIALIGGKGSGCYATRVCPLTGTTGHCKARSTGPDREAAVLSGAERRGSGTDRPGDWA